MAKKVQRLEKETVTSTHKERLIELLDKVENELGQATGKATIADYIRLTQVLRELEEAEPPREVKVTWIERVAKSKPGR
jgi:transcriptional regulator GlxA family with amidase domain